MVTKNGIQTYICSEKEVHSGRTTKDQCARVAISWIMELKQKNSWTCKIFNFQFLSLFSLTNAIIFPTKF